MKVVHEGRRLAFLHSLNILDTPIEEIYERVTRLVCRVLDAPMAAVSLVDEDRLWFKSIQGANISEMPRENSFCTQTIAKTGPMVVQDARLDNRFSTSLAVREEPNVVFYAGNPIEVANGINIGTLCIFDTRPRDLSSDDLQFLEDLSLTVSSEMKARFLKDVYSARHEGRI